MFLKDGQILVDDFRHQNFGIWTILGQAISIFLKKTRNFAHLQSNLVILLIFFTKIAITQPKKVKIQIFLCLKSCTNIWPSFRNIYSVPKVVKIYSEGRKGAKPAKICTFFTLQKIKIAFSQKFSKVWFDGFFLWLPTYETFHISLTNILKQDRCDWRDARVAWDLFISVFREKSISWRLTEMLLVGATITTLLLHSV